MVSSCQKMITRERERETGERERERVKRTSRRSASRRQSFEGGILWRRRISAKRERLSTKRERERSES